MSDDNLHWLARAALRRLDAALVTATPTQTLVWETDVRLHIEAASFGETWREINLVNNALFFVRHKNQTLEQAFESARESVRKPLA